MVLTLGKSVAKLLWWNGLDKALSIFDYRGPMPEQLVQNLLTDLEELGSLAKVLGDNPLESFGADDSELSKKYYPSRFRYYQAILSFFVDITPLRNNRKIKALPTVNETIDHTPNEKWFFLNGIGTNEDMARVNALMLNKIFKRPITPLHNPTNGFARDLIEVTKGRNFNTPTSVARSAKIHIKCELLKIAKRTANSSEYEKKRHKVVVIAHSQGGIIISNVVKMLIHDPRCNSLLKHLEIYTFASAHDEYPSSLTKSQSTKVPFTEHFANDRDYVAEVGVLKNVNKTSGKVYEKSGPGHLLNYHYLRDFDQGKYEGQGIGSRLYSLRNGNR